MNKKGINIGIVGLALTATAIAGFTGWYLEHRQVKELEAQLVEARLQEKRSAVDRSISKQMEEIAYQQREISDEQREEAIQQKRTADEMRQRSEIERQNALNAQKQAKASEADALLQKAIADTERDKASKAQKIAEQNERTADTLKYIAQGRSLGALSIRQHHSGNETIADLLAYASYKFTDPYDRNELYYPDVLQSLVLASNSSHSWSIHNGSLTGICFREGSNTQLVTVSNYGEIISHEEHNETIKSKTLFQNSNYDFRDVLMNKQGTIFAISRTGSLIIVPGNSNTYIETKLEGIQNPSAITNLGVDNLLVAIGENGFAFIDDNTYQLKGTKTFNYKITATGRAENRPLYFDDKRQMHIIMDMKNITTRNCPAAIKGNITAFANSKNEKLDAYGTSDGSIYIVDSHHNVKELDGHRSRISRLKFNGRRLFSSSYDGTINLWVVSMTGDKQIDSETKIDPMQLLSTNSWIMNFTIDPLKDHIWTGHYNGALTETLISIPIMVERIEKKLKRNFTTEEWNYYIGRNVPYQTFIGKEAGK